MTKPRGTVGASDCAALFGEHPYLSRYSLWARETGLLAHEDDERTERQQMGLDLEWPILEIWAKREGKKIRKGIGIRFDYDALVSATPDAFVEPDSSRDEPADAKTVQGHERRAWLDGVPRHYWWQSQQQSLCARAERGWMVALFGVNELGGTAIEADKKAHEQIISEVALFWRQVRGEAPPPTADEHRATIAAMMARKRERKTIDFGDPRIADMVAALDAEYTAANRARIEAEKREAAAKAAILNALGDADRGVFSNGDGYAVSRTQQNRKATEAKTVTVTKLTRFRGENSEEGEDE